MVELGEAFTAAPGGASPASPGGAVALPPFQFPVWRAFSWLVKKLKAHFPPFGFWAGILAAIYFWVTVEIDGYLNRSWWVYQTSSFSALGDPGPTRTGAAAGLAWIYNDVVIFPTAILLMLFSAALVMYARNKVQSTGASLFLVAGMFLFMVGIFHGETVINGLYCNPLCQGGTPYPPAYHDFVSDWFFVEALLAFLVFGVGLLFERRWGLGGAMLLLAVGAPLFLVFWDHSAWCQSSCVAENETIGIVAIDLVALLMLFARRPARRDAVDR